MLAYIFMKSKSWIVWAVWIVVLLAALAGFGYTTYDRIATLISEPTSTTISIENMETLRFPAVTICTLNFIREDRRIELFPQNTGLLDEVVTYGLVDAAQCRSSALMLASTNGFNGGWGNLTSMTGNNISQILPEEFANRNESCRFVGEVCSYQDFVRVPSVGGLCYTFNGKPPFRSVSGTGVLQGLRLTLDPRDDQHYSSFFSDSGMKVVVHEPDEPPRPDAEGIAIPVGISVYIAMRETRTVDRTRYSRRQCRGRDANNNFNVHREYPYSISACLDDCFYTTIADACGCIEPTLYTPDSDQYQQMRRCNLSDICCEKDEFFAVKRPCNCPSACDFTTRSFTVSYSLTKRTTTDDRPISGLQIYYETLNVEVQTTEDAYTPFGLISDIGGNSGLFLGFTLLTVAEVVLWLTTWGWECAANKKETGERSANKKELLHN